MITQILKYIILKKLHLCINTSRIISNKYITIYPPEYFYPLHYNFEFSPLCITNNTYTVHWSNCSWGIKKFVFFLANKHRIPLTVLFRKMKFIEEKDPDANKKVSLERQ